jgi:hypothetical protein
VPAPRIQRRFSGSSWVGIGFQENPAKHFIAKLLRSCSIQSSPIIMLRCHHLITLLARIGCGCAQTVGDAPAHAAFDGFAYRLLPA